MVVKILKSLRQKAKSCVGKAQKPSLPHGIGPGTRQYERLGFDLLLRLASVGCAASLSFARVMTWMLATALALAVVLAFARVLG